MPDTGSLVYSGDAVVTIQNGPTIYDLTGAATAEASFGADTETTVVDDLSGFAIEGLSGPVVAMDVATLNYEGSAISGATYSGGTPTLSSDVLSDLSDSAASSLDGAFFGPDATETGGVFVIDHSVDGSLTIFGEFIAD